MLWTLYQQPGKFMVVILLAVVWSVFWTGLGLWHSARNKQQAYEIQHFYHEITYGLPELQLL